MFALQGCETGGKHFADLGRPLDPFSLDEGRIAARGIVQPWCEQWQHHQQTALFARFPTSSTSAHSTRVNPPPALYPLRFASYSLSLAFPCQSSSSPRRVQLPCAPMRVSISLGTRVRGHAWQGQGVDPEDPTCLEMCAVQ